jgi:hypothetical protein
MPLYYPQPLAGLGLTYEADNLTLDVTSLPTGISITESQVTNLSTDLSNKVPYTGATTDVNLGSHALSATQLQSTIATGTAPLTVTSTTAVTNLNADLLDGQHGSYYAPASAGTGSVSYGQGTAVANDIVTFYDTTGRLLYDGSQANGQSMSILSLTLFKDKTLGYPTVVGPPTTSNNYVDFHYNSNGYTDAYDYNGVNRTTWWSTYAPNQVGEIRGNIKMHGGTLYQMPITWNSADLNTAFSELVAQSTFLSRNMLNVISFSLETPPGSPSTGDTYQLPLNGTATGAWAGQDGLLATWNGTTWVFTNPSVPTLILNGGNLYQYGSGASGSTLIGPNLLLTSVVPYTGATTDVNLGSHAFTTTGWINGPSISTSNIVDSVGRNIIQSSSTNINVGNAQDPLNLVGTAVKINGTALAYEPPLGNPSSNEQVLSSTTAGVRSWVTPSGTTFTAAIFNGVYTPSAGNILIGNGVGWQESSITNVMSAYVPYGGASTTNLITNLNADLLDGQHGTAFEPALGNPPSDGCAVVSTAAGVRSWATSMDLHNPRSYWEVGPEDFFNTTYLGTSQLKDWVCWFYGTAGYDISGENNQYGGYVININTAGNPNFAAIHVNTQALRWGYGTMNFISRFKMRQLSTAGAPFIIRSGISWNWGDYQGNPACCFRYREDKNGGRWVAALDNGSTDTYAVDTGVTADLAWHIFAITVNAGATIVKFYIDDIQVATFDAHTAFPLGYRTDAYAISLISRTAGSATVYADIDYAWVWGAKDRTYVP